MRVSPLNNVAPWRRPPPSKTAPPAVTIEEDAPSQNFYLIVKEKVGIYREEKHLILESLSAETVWASLDH